MNEYEELKVAMMQLLESDKSLAAHIGAVSRNITDSIIEEEQITADKKMREQLAVFFCIGASWAITKLIKQ